MIVNYLAMIGLASALGAEPVRAAAPVKRSRGLFAQLSPKNKENPANNPSAKPDADAIKGAANPPNPGGASPKNNVEAAPKSKDAPKAEAIPKAESKDAPKAVAKEPAAPAAAPAAAAAPATPKEPPPTPTLAASPAEAADTGRPYVPITSQLDVPYRKPCICIYEPWETASWWIGTKSLFLTRSLSEANPLVVTANSAQIASTNVFELPMKFGQEVFFGHLADTAHGAEASYIWLADGTASYSIDDPNRPPFGLPVETPGGIGVIQTTRFAAQLKSKFWSADVNYLQLFHDGTDHPVRFIFLAGFRMISLEESIDGRFTRTADGVREIVSIDAENALYGGQIGGRVTYRELLPGLNLESMLKFGMFGNVLQGRNSLSGQDVNFFQGTTAGTTRFSSAIDFGVEAVYKWRESVHFTLGYRLMYIYQVARANSQIPVNPFSQRFDSGDDLFMTGLSLGVRIFWGNRTDPNCRSGSCTPYVMITDSCSK